MYRIVEQSTTKEPIHVHGEVPPIGAKIRSSLVHVTDDANEKPESKTYEVIDIQWILSGPTHRATMAATVVVVEVE